VAKRQKTKDKRQKTKNKKQKTKNKKQKTKNKRQKTKVEETKEIYSAHYSGAVTYLALCIIRPAAISKTRV
jgi:hypothetical protein